MRHSEKEMGVDDIASVLANGRLLTLAMCKDEEPYLVTVNYAYAPDERAFFFHCAKTGKKVDYLQSNPVVWGQVLEDNGYVQGKCEHHYRTVHFKGRATILESDDEVRGSIILLINQQEDDPAPVKKRNIETGKYKGAAMVRIDVEDFTGKEGK